MRVKVEEFLKTLTQDQRQRRFKLPQKRQALPVKDVKRKQAAVIIESCWKPPTRSQLNEIQEAVKKKVDLAEWTVVHQWQHDQLDTCVDCATALGGTSDGAGEANYREPSGCSGRGRAAGSAAWLANFVSDSGANARHSGS